MAHARNCQRIELYTAFNDPADDNLRTAFRELVRRRAAGTPVAYLVGYREFYSLRFRVTSDVLIPRPETESLVVAALDWAQNREPSDGRLEIVDIGTGSGILAVTLARYLPAAQVTAVDISAKALGVVRQNAGELGVGDRIKLVESDLFSALAAERKFDLVVSNPPYVSTAEMQGLAPDVREHEPAIALEAGAGGTSVIERLIPQAADRLRPGGQLFIEISPMLERRAGELLAAEGRLAPCPTIKDLAGLARVVQARRRSD